MNALLFVAGLVVGVGLGAVGVIAWACVVAGVEQGDPVWGGEP